MDAYIKFEGKNNPILGESRDSQLTGAKGWSSLMNLEFSGEHKANIGTSTTGSSAHAVDLKEFKIDKQVDNASPQLFMALCSGDTYDKVTVAVRKASGGSKASATPYLQYVFAQVFVTNISTSLGSSDDFPKESVTFEYAASQITYTPQDVHGQMTSNANMAQWSKATNSASLAVFS